MRFNLKTSSSLLFLCLHQASAIDLDVGSLDSIKSAAKTLAGGIINTYNNNFSADSIGLFSTPHYFWEAGAVLDGLVEYAYLTGDDQWNGLVKTSLQAQVGPNNDYMPPNQTKGEGNDDQSQWALAALTAAELAFPRPDEGEWVDMASAVFDEQSQRWDADTCGGGIRWQIFTFNAGYSYKNAYASGNFFLLAARLARYTGNTTYSDWAEKQFAWAQEIGLISDNYSVYDGADTSENCTSVNHIHWTSNLGVFLEGAAVMYNITNGGGTWKEHVSGFVKATSVLTSNDTGIISDLACEQHNTCNIDQADFKGIYARSLARAAQSAPYTYDTIRPLLETSAKGAANVCTMDQSSNATSCYLTWFHKAGTQGGLGETFSAMEVVQALLYPEAKGVQNANETQTGSPNATTSGTPSGASGTTARSATGTGAAGAINVHLGVVAFAGLFSMAILGL